MDALDRLESERGGQFRIRHDGEVHELASPLDLSWESVATILTGGTVTFSRLLGPLGSTLPTWKIEAAAEAWRVHYGLTDADDTRRLLYYLRRYPEAIESDLMAIPSLPPLAEMWQQRQWRRILLAIDHLPRTSYFTDAVASDEEHAEQVLKAQESIRAMEKKARSMPFTAYSPEVAVLADVVDSLRHLLIATIAVNSSKGAQLPKFEPYDRPVPATARIKHKVMLEKHEALANRMLARRQQQVEDTR